jgi:hypothetical protein
MKMPNPQIIADEPHSLTPEPSHTGNRTPRRSHVSVASNKRSSMNAGATNPNKVKQGMFRRAVPQMPRFLACICFVLNLVLPGTGMNSTKQKRKRSLMTRYPVCQFTLDMYG